MRLEAKKHFYDIEQAVARLVEFTADRAFADYTRDAMLRAAVERKFEIIEWNTCNRPAQELE